MWLPRNLAGLLQAAPLGASAFRKRPIQPACLFLLAFQPSTRLFCPHTIFQFWPCRLQKWHLHMLAQCRRRYGGGKPARRPAGHATPRHPAGARSQRQRQVQVHVQCRFSACAVQVKVQVQEQCGQGPVQAGADWCRPVQGCRLPGAEVV